MKNMKILYRCSQKRDRIKELIGRDFDVEIIHITKIIKTQSKFSKLKLISMMKNYHQTNSIFIIILIDFAYKSN